MLRRPSSAPNRGFTLVELLVVVAILMVLMALLLPALARSKEEASRLVCRANLRQQAVAYSQFRIDHDNALPQTNHQSVGRIREKAELLGYTGSNTDAWICPQFYSRELNNAMRGGGYGGLLLTRRDWSTVGGPGYPVQWEVHPNAGSFGWFGWPRENRYHWASVDMATGVWVYRPWPASYLVGINKASLIRKPSHSALLTEIFPYAGGWPGWDGRAFDEMGGNARHGGTPWEAVGGNVLYVDGHARWSTTIGPTMHWNKMCFTRPPEQ